MRGMTMTEIRVALESAVEELPRGLRNHVLRVVADARRLAGCHGVDEERATLAALGHDLARGESPSELLRQAEAVGLELSDIERREPMLIHGALSARIMADRFIVEDEEVLAAARYHTTGRAGMSALERVIYVADKVEPEKARRVPELAEARRLADESLEAAMRGLLDLHVMRALERGWPLHPNTVAARNEVL